jgi:hypothetical protein
VSAHEWVFYTYTCNRLSGIRILGQDPISPTLEGGRDNKSIPESDGVFILDAKCSRDFGMCSIDAPDIPQHFVEVNPERTVGLDNKDWRGGILGSQRSRGAFSPNRVQYSRTSDLAVRSKQRRSIHQGSESRYEPFQGSTTSSPQSPKSATLRVASLARRTRAMAAICASA